MMPLATVDRIGEAGPSWNEAERSAALKSYGLLDTPREKDFDEIARIACEICGTPVAALSLIDTERQYFKAEIGLGIRSIPLMATSAHSLLLEDVVVVADITRDLRFEHNPLVVTASHLRAYAGAVLKTHSGLPIGTICVLDDQVRDFTDQQISMLRFLARQTMTQLEMRKTVMEQRRLLVQTAIAERARVGFERIVKQASDFIGIIDVRGGVQFLNDAARLLVGLNHRQEPPRNILEYIAECDRERFRNCIMPLVKSGRNLDLELRLRNLETGAEFPAQYTIFPLRDHSGDILGYGIVTKDITEQKEQELKKTQIMSEAAHRIKNSLALVQAIVSQTLRSSSSIEESRVVISKRLTALARAQDILTAGEGSAADIIDVVESALSPHDAGNHRFVYSGPAHFLTSSQALGLSLALHELATNATKYGALSSDHGSVKIKWEIADDRRFSLEWTEQDGPRVEPPSTTGFGSKLIERMVAPYFNGRASLRFRPSGVVFLLEGQLADN